ncbi:CopG family antitoxin [Pistricoccus aurantiacus]|uniref:CopG family antitoxin n=1 Tax=Pistricoccus aurantiacus TaxID=1883414 RepID=UPI00363F0E1C
MNKLKKMPEFKTEAEEREFWETHNSSDYLDWNQAKPASFPKLKPSTKNYFTPPARNTA